MNSKGLSIAIGIMMFTAVAMAALVADKMHVTKVCRDVRVAMDGAIDAVVENGGLNSHYAVTLFEKRNLKSFELESVNVNPQYGTNSKGYETFQGDNLRLVISDRVNPKNGRHPASLQGEVDGKNISVTMGCSQ